MTVGQLFGVVEWLPSDAPVIVAAVNVSDAGGNEYRLHEVDTASGEFIPVKNQRGAKRAAVQAAKCYMRPTASVLSNKREG
jgi:hypothetical protein